MPLHKHLPTIDQKVNLKIAQAFNQEGDLAIAEAFAARGLAPLLDEHSLPQLLGVGTALVRWIVRRPARHYRHFTIRKRNGSVRHIFAPRTYLKVIQWWINDNILKSVPLDNCVTGFRVGSSPLKNAMMHTGARHILNMDLKDFFPSIQADRVRAMWASFGYSEFVVNQLTTLTTHHGQLPQGAPTSPHIANIVARELDKELTAWAEINDCLYTRYADDITFSSNKFIEFSFARTVAQLCESCGFEINSAKTRCRGKGERLEVTGYVVNERIQPPRAWRKRARAIFHQAVSNPAEFSSRFAEIQGYFGAVAAYCRPEDRLYRDGLGALEAMRIYSKRANSI
jgi:RNA-directed DNA polymerase